MRIGVISNKSLAHKQTCLSLYRILLKQTLLLPPNLSKPLLDVITQRFHLDRTITSPSVIVSALQTARSALSLIHSAAAEAEAEAAAASTNSHDINDNVVDNDNTIAVPTTTPSLTTLHNLVTNLITRAGQTHSTLLHQHSLRSPTSPRKSAKIAHLQNANTKFWAQRIPDSPPILSRPVPQTVLPFPNLKRRVPFLVNAQGVPFLRYKSGPTSVKLSHVIRSRAAQANNRWALHDRMIEDIASASLEDHWDTLVYEFTGFKDPDELDPNDNPTSSRWRGGTARSRGNMLRTRSGEAVIEFEGLRGSKSWTVANRDALENVRREITRMGVQRERMVRVMKGIVEGERELAGQERRERKRVARQRWLEETGQLEGLERERREVDDGGGGGGGGGGAGIGQRHTEKDDGEGRDGMTTVRPFTITRSGLANKQPESSVEYVRQTIANPKTTSSSSGSPSGPRKKVIRRPWDPDWVSKPKR